MEPFGKAENYPQTNELREKLNKLMTDPNCKITPEVETLFNQIDEYVMESEHNGSGEANDSVVLYDLALYWAAGEAINAAE